MNEDKIKIKKSSREKNKTKMRSQRLNNYLTKTKNIKKYLTHNNTNILSSNSNLEEKTIKNEQNRSSSMRLSSHDHRRSGICRHQ